MEVEGDQLRVRYSIGRRQIRRQVTMPQRVRDLSSLYQFGFTILDAAADVAWVRATPTLERQVDPSEVVEILVTAGAAHELPAQRLAVWSMADGRALLIQDALGQVYRVGSTGELDPIFRSVLTYADNGQASPAFRAGNRLSVADGDARRVIPFDIDAAFGRACGEADASAPRLVARQTPNHDMVGASVIRLSTEPCTESVLTPSGRLVSNGRIWVSEHMQCMAN